MYDRRLREVVVSLGGGRFMEIRILQIVGVVVGEVRSLASGAGYWNTRLQTASLGRKLVEWTRRGVAS